MASIFAEFLHHFSSARKLAKKIYRYKTIRQQFYGGSIFFNAVDFSFLWTKNKTAEKHDREIQDALLQLSRDNDLFIDIGSNIGIMTLSVALRNSSINLIAVDPNREILGYLNKSISASGLEKRISVVNAAVSNKEGKAFMDFSKGSYAGHLAEKGVEVEVKSFRELLAQHKLTKTLFKLDIEGFESLLIPILAEEKNNLHTYVIEMHPAGMNNISTPDKSLAILLNNGFNVTSVDGDKLTKPQDIKPWDNIVCRYEKR